MGWGTSWGRTWGGGAEDDVVFALLSARAVASNVVRATFSKPPLLSTPLGLGDASRLSNWSLTRTDATETIQLLAARPVLGDPFSVEFIRAGRWAGALAEYELALITGAFIFTADLQKKLLPPASAAFLGLPLPVPKTERRDMLVDLLNPQTAGDRINGGLVTTTAGDYALESGAQLVKKLIVREILTARGEFLHLADTTYGLGLVPKEPARDSDRESIEKKLKARVLSYPEVRAASVTATISTEGIFTISVRAQTAFGNLEATIPEAVQL